MKTLIYGIFLILFSTSIYAQSEFVPADYIEFIDQNRDLTAAELLDQYPPQSIYYSSRQYPLQLNSVPYYDSVDSFLGLTEGEKGLLEQNYFMVTERLSFQSWINALSQVYSADIPLFLSTDFVLFTLHQSYDEVLKIIEYRVLEPNLMIMLDAMAGAFPDIYETYSTSPELQASLADVDLYIAIARSLIYEEEILPLKTSDSHYRVIMEALASEKLVEIPLFTADTLFRKLDFSQFRPRGHYTDIIYTNQGARTLESYFKAMMWLGRIDFLLTAPPENPWEPNWSDESLLRMNLSALILNEVLDASGKKSLFDTHDKIISFMVGPDDNMSPDELRELAENNLASPLDLLDETVFDNYRELLNGSDDYGQKIMSNFFYVDPDSTDPGQLPVSFKLLGQKFLVDSYVFSEVVYDRIAFNGKKIWRPMPDPLDMLSVFGNENAMALMKSEMESYKYAYKISQLKYLVDSYDDTFWTQSLYNTWLSSIRSLNPPAESEGLPYFMKTSAWYHEKLNTQLCSWAQLRHDNILYGKQSYTGGTGCSYPYTYVEAYPDFYRAIKSFAENASVFFNENLTAADPDLALRIKSYYDNYANIVGKLGHIAEKERSSRALSDDDLLFLKTMINDYMSSGPSVSGWVNDMLFDAMDKWDFDYTVADVHTQPTDENGNPVGNVLHVGNGMINLGVFIAPNTVEPDKLMCYVGPLASFHTQVKNDFYRLNDDEWKDMFLSAIPPERPEWVRAYLADIDGNVKMPENILKGEVFTGIQNISVTDAPLSYILTYPNPAVEEVRFRFVLNEKANIEAGIFDVSGRKIIELYSGTLEKAEHDLSLPLKDTRPGMYFMKMQVNGQDYIQRFLVM